MKRLNPRGQSKSISEQHPTEANPPASSSTQHTVFDGRGIVRGESTSQTKISDVSSKYMAYNDTSETKADAVFAQSPVPCALAPSIESTVSEKTIEKPEKKNMPKRRKLNTSMIALFQTIQNCLNEDKAPPLVLSPRSLFQQLCRVHDDVYPKLLPENTIKTIFEILPSTR